MSTTDDYLAEVEQRDQAATGGPWEVDGSLIQGSAPGQAHIGQTWGIRWHADAEFIAHARTDVPRLVKALRVALDVVEQLAGDCAHHGAFEDNPADIRTSGGWVDVIDYVEEIRTGVTEALGGERA